VDCDGRQAELSDADADEARTWMWMRTRRRPLDCCDGDGHHITSQTQRPKDRIAGDPKDCCHSRTTGHQNQSGKVLSVVVAFGQLEVTRLRACDRRADED
jgi:hypothetical protein